MSNPIIATPKNVILYDNKHAKDYWSHCPLGTWLIIEDNGTVDGGKVLAEFRFIDHAQNFIRAMGWTYNF